NNYDTRVFAFFIPIHGKIFIFILTTPSYGDEPKYFNFCTYLTSFKGVLKNGFAQSTFTSDAALFTSKKR
ncbi:hypothetical protein, partial [Paranoxybacillus vitaminiphilus]|uniref:hypothetical protein n=1 Tax=Paranoxybacillus vitaminiphilus TaxID=581036 RepID=UPI001C6576ED